MRITFDQKKSAENEEKRCLSFELVEKFQWTTALTGPDTRRDYGERRYIAIGFIDDRLHVLIYTKRGDALRVISLRRANKREIRLYETQTKSIPD